MTNHGDGQAWSATLRLIALGFGHWRGGQQSKTATGIDIGLTNTLRNDQWLCPDLAAATHTSLTVAALRLCLAGIANLSVAMKANLDHVAIVRRLRLLTAG